MQASCHRYSMAFCTWQLAWRLGCRPTLAVLLWGGNGTTFACGTYRVDHLTRQKRERASVWIPSRGQGKEQRCCPDHTGGA